MAAELQPTFQDVLTDLLGPDASEPVCQAIREGDERQVRQFCAEVPSLATLGPKTEAIEQGRPDFLRLLLESNNTISETLVAAAYERRDRDSVRALLGCGWQINTPVYSTASLVCFAIDDEDFMQWLIGNGADVDAVSNLDEPVLAMAIAHGSMGVVRLLLTQGADIRHGNLLHCAAQRRNTP